MPRQVVPYGGVTRGRSNGGTASNASMGTDDKDVADGETVPGVDGGLMDPCNAVGIGTREPEGCSGTGTTED